MAKFRAELPRELLEEFRKLADNSSNMIEEMVTAGAEVVYDNVVSNMQGSFEDANKLIPYLKVTRVYRTPSDDGTNRKIAFYGYYKDKAFTVRNKKNGDIYSYVGVPVPLIVRAREFGSSSGEQKKPFFRKSFNKNQIESAMLQIQKRYINE